jgi:hypothetical protein
VVVAEVSFLIESCSVDSFFTIAPNCGVKHDLVHKENTTNVTEDLGTEIV